MTNGSVIFDNGTGQNMQADFSDYNAHASYIWGNATFELEYARWYTDVNNYFYVDIAQEYTTTPTEYTVPLAFYSIYGTPSRSNISWIEFRLNTLDNSNPLTIWTDLFHLGTTESIRFVVDNNGEESYLCEHIHLNNTWSSTEISLNKTKLLENGYNFTLFLNDTLPSPDAFNTSFEIDYIFITMWNDTIPTTTTTTTEAGGGVVPPTTTTPITTNETTITTTLPYRGNTLLIDTILVVGAIAVIIAIVMILKRETKN